MTLKSAKQVHEQMAVKVDFTDNQKAMLAEALTEFYENDEVELQVSDKQKSKVEAALSRREFYTSSQAKDIVAKATDLDL